MIQSNSRGSLVKSHKLSTYNNNFRFSRSVLTTKCPIVPPSHICEPIVSPSLELVI